MGSGKSSNGRQLARRLGYRFVDTDHLVVSGAGMEIAEIFRAHGETHFRDLESQALRSLTQEKKIVVATGGGIIMSDENLALLREIGLVVWLRASEEAVFERVSRNKKRPLMNVADPRETIRKLFAERLPRYEGAADMVVDTTFLPRSDVVKAIITEVRRRKKKTADGETSETANG